MKLLSSKQIKPFIPAPFDEKVREEIRNNLSTELSEIVEKAKNKGYEEGFKKGYEEGLNRASEEVKKYQDTIKSKIADLDRLIRQLSNLKLDLIKNFLPEIINLSISIARKVVSEEISINKNVVLKLLKEALKEVSLSEQLIIKLNPIDYKNLSQELIELTKENPSISIISSDEISPGGCLIESQEKIIESTVEDTFREIENAFNSIIFSKD